MKELHLVGTVHIDPFGSERLEKAIDTIRPSLITVEFENRLFKKDKIQETRYLIKDYLHKANKLLEFENSAFEKMLRFSDSYMSEILMLLDMARHIPVVPIDINLKSSVLPKNYDASSEFFQTVSKYTHLYEISGLSGSVSACLLLANFTAYGLLPDKAINEYLESAYRETYKREDLVIRNVEERDINMEEEIRLYCNQTDGNVMHIGGFAHIYFDYFNLYDRLTDLSPQRHKLNEFD